MHKADFEKNVQEKMQELRFQPSEEVWKRVEQSIDEKRRRPIGYFWLAAALLVVAFGIYHYGFNNNVSDRNYSNNKSGNNSNQPGQTIASKKSIPAANVATHKQTIEAQTPGEKSISDAHAADVSSFDKVNNRNSKNPNSKGSNSTGSISKNSVYRHERISGPPVKDLAMEGDQLLENNTTTKTNISHDPRYSSPIAAGTPLLMKSFSPSPLDLNTLYKAPTIPLATKNNWEYGLIFSAGISNLAKGLLSQDSLGGSYAFSTGGPAGYIPHGASGVRNGLAFSVGANISRWLGAKWKVGVGLQYEYFSNTITVGSKVDSTLSIRPNNMLSTTVNGYYTSTGSTTYHNKYHFISLPVSVNWQFAHQFSWENQVIYSRLITTNALHFDGPSGAYYKDRERFDNNQFIFATAFKYGWNNNKFQVGPQFLYGLSNLLKQGSPTDQHLISFVLKANMRLSKN